ncbi:hypothetical protein KYC_08085 [Achromobacter arsenitoxydans SY8]|uniref:Transmembrane protein n=1 Tax=Achromobacter arsenitoxydans SY8 TaxID=477184 RepID=H0F4C5_9BURK|nr:hypothetical protein KYC_08085 [Achromobacter arsenitoxydans SY8]
MLVPLALLLTGLLFIPLGPLMPRDGLDPSWRYALNMAVENGYVFGRDLIFTFGPLGSVYSTVYSPFTDHMMMWASALYAAGFVFAIHLSAPRQRQWCAIMLPVLVSLFILRDAFFLVLPFFLLLAALRTTRFARDPYRLNLTPSVLVGLAVATLAMGIGPIVKGSFSAVVLPIGALTFIALVTSNVRLAVAFAALLLAGTAGSWAFSGQALADLPEFFMAQGPVVSSYTDAMSREGSSSAIVYFLLLVLLVCGAFAFALRRAFGRGAVLACLALALTAFISFKAGFVRQDDHVFMALGVLLLLAYGASLYVKKISVIAGLWIAMTLTWFAVGSSVVNLDAEFFAEKVLANWERTYKGIKIRTSKPEALIEQYDSAVSKIRAAHPLPPLRGAVDLYPNELSALFANDLIWSGRPIPQSYAAYDPILDSKNVEHLRSSAAPDSVLFSFAPIDGRLPAQDDSGSVLELLSTYSVSALEPPYVLLKKREGPRTAKLDAENRIEMRRGFGEWIDLNPRQPVWLQAEIKPTFLGKVVSTLFRLPPVEIEITLGNGTSLKKRLIPKIAEAGFIVSPYLTEPSDFVSLAAGADLGNNVKSVRITTSGERLWQDNFLIKLTPISIVPQKSARALLFGAPEDRPPWADLPQAELGSAQCMIDSVNGAPYRPGSGIANPNGVLQLQGWMAPNRQDDELGAQPWAVVELPDGSTNYYKAKAMKRPDVAAALKRPALSEAGFTLTLDMSEFRGTKKISLVSVVDGKVFSCAELGGPILVN